MLAMAPPLPAPLFPVAAIVVLVIFVLVGAASFALVWSSSWPSYLVAPIVLGVLLVVMPLAIVAAPSVEQHWRGCWSSWLCSTSCPAYPFMALASCSWCSWPSLLSPWLSSCSCSSS